MECKFCNEYKQETDQSIRPERNNILPERYEVYLRLCTEVSSDSHLSDILLQSRDKYKINYCPMCGKRLTDNNSEFRYAVRDNNGQVVMEITAAATDDSSLFTVYYHEFMFSSTGDNCYPTEMNWLQVKMLLYAYDTREEKRFIKDYRKWSNRRA